MEKSGRNGFLKWLTGVPVALAFALIVLLWPTRSMGSVGPQWIAPVVNGICAILILLLVAVLAARSMLAGERRSLVLLGSGMLAYAAVSAVGAVSVLFGHLSEGVRILNIGQFMAGGASLAGSLALLRPSGGPPDWTRRRALLACYGGMLALIAVVAGAAYGGLIPPFLQPGTGPTVWRRVVLAATIGEFACSCAFLLLASRRTRSRFLLLYAMGLGLIALGTTAVCAIRTVGNPLGWAGTLSVYAGMGYLLAAAVVAVRRSGRLSIPVESLRETRHRYLSLVAQSPDAIVIHAAGRFVFANMVAATLFGAENGDDLVGRVVLDLVHPDFRETAEARQRRLDTHDGPLPLEEMTIFRLDGTPVEVEMAAASVEYEGRAAVQAIMRDITARKRAGEALRESEQRLFQILSSMNFGILLVSENDTIDFANQAFCDIFELRDSPGDLMALSAAEVVARIRPCYRDPEAATARIREIVMLRQPVRGEEAPLRGKRSLLRDFIPMYVGGKQHGRLWLHVDITDRKEAEEALRRARDELERRVDRRTAELASTVERLEQEAAARVRTQEELRGLNLSLQDQADQLRRLSLELTMVEQRERKRLALILHDNLQQLLTAARFRADLFRRLPDEKLQAAAADVDNLLSQAIEASRTLTSELSPPLLFEAGLLPALKWLARWMEEKHGLAVDLQAREEVNPIDEGTSIFLFRSVRELLFNVLKHGKVRTVFVGLKEEDGRVEILIQDRGVGFDPANVVDHGGIGLFGIREQLAIRGGRLEIDSAPGRGSRVQIVMPLDPAPLRLNGPHAPIATAAGPRAPVNGFGAAAPPTAKARAIRVLLVDDHPVVRQGLAQLLGTYADIEIVGEAGDGEQAVEQARRLKPDVVVMDVSMPKMSGIEATTVIHREQPGIRVIGLSIYEAADQAAAMREAGACGFVTKSGPTTEILEAIRTAASGQG